jgi:hypothetical protein
MSRFKPRGTFGVPSLDLDVPRWVLASVPENDAELKVIHRITGSYELTLECVRAISEGLAYNPFVNPG